MMRKLQAHERFGIVFVLFSLIGWTFKMPEPLFWPMAYLTVVFWLTALAVDLGTVVQIFGLGPRRWD